MENKKFDIVDAILEKFDYHPYGKDRKNAVEQLDETIGKLRRSLNYNQDKLLRIVEEKQGLVIIEHEKELAYYVMECLRSIFSEFK